MKFSSSDQFDSSSRSEFLSTKQAADLLGVCVRTIQIWADSGALPNWVTPGGHRRISVSAVRELARKRQSAIGFKEHPQEMPVSGEMFIYLVSTSRMLEVAIRTNLKSLGITAIVKTYTLMAQAVIEIGRSTPDALILDFKDCVEEASQLVYALRQMEGAIGSLPIAAINLKGRDRYLLTSLSMHKFETENLPESLFIFVRALETFDV